jgi:hypothetical protein
MMGCGDTGFIIRILFLRCPMSEAYLIRTMFIELTLELNVLAQHSEGPEVASNNKIRTQMFSHQDGGSTFLRQYQPTSHHEPKSSCTYLRTTTKGLPYHYCSFHQNNMNITGFSRVLTMVYRNYEC